MTKDEALKMAMGVLLSINQGKQHLIVIDDDRGFFQREEWVRWAIDEVVPQIKEALEQPLTRDWKETIDERVAKDDAFKQALEQPAQEVKCNPHPDAPHGFMRDESHSQDRYVCECEYWTPPAQEPVGYIVPDYQNVMHARDGHTLMAQEKTDLHKIPVYTHPAPSWQGLSDDEIDDVKTKAIMGANGMSVEQLLGFIVSLTEQALKTKNG